ncbi:MAG: lysophospholipid acyltransferase family protein [Gemmatimonadota bacterium]|nr:1-acyl-sn-glycerol-3-phosphate acyltransferase [Gemmatimonadota bacterium]
MLRTLWVLAYGVVLTAVYATRAILGGLLRPADAPCTCDRLARIWGARIVRASGSTIEVEGAEHIDPAQPHILIANHESWFDVFAVLGHVPGRFRFVAKKELARIPIFGQAWRMCGHISVDRSDRSSAVQSLQQAAGRIREDGLTIVLFPEGTRSATGHLLPFKKGAFVLAIQSRVPLVPVAVAGTRQIMPKGSFRVRPGHIRIKVGAPIETAGLTHEDRDALLQRSHDAIAELKGAIGGVPDGDPHTARAGDDRS